MSPVGEGHGNPLQNSCLENPMDRGAWWATVYEVAKSGTCLSVHAHTVKLMQCQAPCLTIYQWMEAIHRHHRAHLHTAHLLETSQQEMLATIL